MPSGNYKNNVKEIPAYLALHVGETFSLDDICRHIDRNMLPDQRNDIAEDLWRRAKAGNLEKNARLYKVIDTNIIRIPYSQFNSQVVVDFKWPYDHDNNTHFPFNGNINVYSGDLIVFAGQSGEGKSTMCRNVAAENIDGAMPIRMMVNEYAPRRLYGILQRMNWTNWFNEDGTERLDLIERHEDWHYAIAPDAINIIDWISLPGDKTYEIGKVLERIKMKLKKGIAVVAIQKHTGKLVGVGGDFSKELAQVYFLIDKGIITVDKCTDWSNVNPKGAVYGFAITDGGARFSNIRAMKLCPKCGNRQGATVYDRERGGYIKCENCGGIGYVSI